MAICKCFGGDKAGDIFDSELTPDGCLDQSLRFSWEESRSGSPLPASWGWKRGSSPRSCSCFVPIVGLKFSLPFSNLTPQLLYQTGPHIYYYIFNNVKLQLPVAWLILPFNPLKFFSKDPGCHKVINVYPNNGAICNWQTETLSMHIFYYVLFLNLFYVQIWWWFSPTSQQLTRDPHLSFNSGNCSMNYLISWGIHLQLNR